MSDSIANGGCCSGSVRPGTYGNASTVAQVTVDKCGRITKVSNVLISNISSDSIIQPFANLVVSNSVTTTNVFVHGTLTVDGSMTANTVNTTFFFDTLTIPFIVTSNLTVSNLIASTGDMNVYGNVITNGYIQAIEYYGDGGLLSNISSDSIVQPFANLVVSNSVTTTNIFATSANIATMNVGYLTVDSAVVYGTSTLNVYGTSNLTNVTVTDTFNVNGSMTANAANATFLFDTFTIPYINTQELNVSSVMNFTGPLATISNLSVLGNTNMEYLSVSNLSVTGNLYVTATNVQTTNALTINNSGTMTAFKVTQNETSIHTHNVAEFWDATTLAMVIDPEGNVAIHTASSPGYVLTVTGPANFETLYIRGNDGLTTLNVTGNVYASNAVTTTNVFTANVTATGIQTIAGLTGRTTLNVTGNVYASNAVTTTNVFATSVSVADTMTIAGAAGKTSLNVTGNIYASTSITGASVVGTHYGIIAGSNTIAASSITASGNITSLSDERLKKNIRHIENPLEKIKKVNGYLFQRTDIDGDFTGVLAQEFLDVLPEVVQMDGNGVYSVSYGNIVALLIEALKEETRLREKLAAQLNIQ